MHIEVQHSDERKVKEIFQRHFYIGSKVREKSYTVKKKEGKKERNYKKEML